VNWTKWDPAEDFFQRCF